MYKNDKMEYIKYKNICKPKGNSFSADEKIFLSK